MFHWIHHLFNPHCEHCRDDKKDDRVCPTCEVYKYQLEQANIQIDKLVGKITEKPAPPVINTKPPQITRPKAMPWAVRRQMLEAEDRAKAASMRNAGQPDATTTTPAVVDVSDLEKELDLAAENRDAAESKPA